jgi:Mce-associated membrane protein
MENVGSQVDKGSPPTPDIETADTLEPGVTRRLSPKIAPLTEDSVSDPGDSEETGLNEESKSGSELNLGRKNIRTQLHSRWGVLRSAGRHKAWTASVFALILAIAVSTVATVMLSGKLSQASQEDSLRASALAAGREAATAMTSIKTATAQQDIDHLLSLSIGDFKDQFAQQAPTVVQVVTKGQVDSTGRAVESGLMNSNDSTAQVLTAVSATVKNSEAANGEQRNFRMKVSLVRQGDRWMVTNLEFVA